MSAASWIHMGPNPQALKQCEDTFSPSRAQDNIPSCSHLTSALLFWIWHHLLAVDTCLAIICED